MRLEINSRKLDQTFRFWAPDQISSHSTPYGGYLRLEGTRDGRGNCLDCRSATEDGARQSFERQARAYVRRCVRESGQ
jgi:hypothetical protein